MIKSTGIENMATKIAKKILVFFLCFFCLIAVAKAQNFLSTDEGKRAFAADISILIEKTWKNWQDSITIDNVSVEGSNGILIPGSISDFVMQSDDMLKHFDRKGRSQDYINCVIAVSKALENGMRSWQRGYRCERILFPQGASCSYTLSPCENIPINIRSGHSIGDKNMSENELYSYLLYRAPKAAENELVVFRAIAKSISECFGQWQQTCSISGIVASGGIAPIPAPIGTGPGPVRGAKGNGGKFLGPYITSDQLYARIMGYLETGDINIGS